MLRGVPCSFSSDTPVSTSKGLKPFIHLTAGELALTFNEENGQLEYRPIIAIWSHLDEVIVQVTLDNGEVIETTPEHPFMLRGERWVEAGVLKVGDEVRHAGGYGLVEAMEIIEEDQMMYNLTVAETDTYFVGQGQWLVHNDCIKEQTELFEKYAASYSNIPSGDIRACTLCAAKAGLDPKYAGQSRVLLYYRDRGHAVLGVGDSLDNMIIVDISPFARVMGGTNVPIAEYNAKMGYPEITSPAEAERAILQVILGRKE